MDGAPRDGTLGQRVGVVVIHGVGETEPGWINDYLVPRLDKQAEDIAFEPHSEVYRLPDKGRSKPGAQFNAFLRQGTVAGGRQVAVAELFWNDLSKIGSDTLGSFLAFLKLFYEAPQVLGEAMLAQCKSGAFGVLRFLILAANWILRWPITGLNVAAFMCAIVLILLRQSRNIAFLKDFEPNSAYPIAIILILLAIGAFFFARWRLNRDVALTDIGLSTAIFSAVLLVAVAVSWVFTLVDPKAGPAPYLLAAGNFIFFAWAVWSHLVVLAIVLLAILGIGRLFGIGKGGVPLRRPAAALALNTLQGIIWKIAITLLWVLLIGALEPGSFDQKLCPPGYLGACRELSTDLVRNVIGIFVFNLVFAMLIVGAFATVVATRVGVRKWLKGRKRLDVGAASPRLIVNRFVTAFLLAGTLFNFWLFYGYVYAKLLSGYAGMVPLLPDILPYFPGDPYAKLQTLLLDNGLLGAVIGGTTTFITLYAYAIGALQDASRGVIHILRDIVDHQYSPRDSMARFVFPNAMKDRGAHPRRKRIEERLDVLMQNVVTEKNFDHLIFVAHSQGSVILYDYLRSKRDEKSIQGARRIDIVTVGSPLTHLYQYYFDNYDQENVAPETLNEKLGSWKNFWRIDDAIGNRVDIMAGGFVGNQPLGAGGHVDYWEEREVRSAILDLITPPVRAPA